jgi:hypothetical protein
MTLLRDREPLARVVRGSGYRGTKGTRLDSGGSADTEASTCE